MFKNCFSRDLSIMWLTMGMLFKKIYKYNPYSSVYNDRALNFDLKKIAKIYLRGFPKVPVLIGIVCIAGFSVFKSRPATIWAISRSFIISGGLN